MSEKDLKKKEKKPKGDDEKGEKKEKKEKKKGDEAAGGEAKEDDKEKSEKKEKKKKGEDAAGGEAKEDDKEKSEKKEKKKKGEDAAGGEAKEGDKEKSDKKEKKKKDKGDTMESSQITRVNSTMSTISQKSEKVKAKKVKSNSVSHPSSPTASISLEHSAIQHSTPVKNDTSDQLVPEKGESPKPRTPDNEPLVSPVNNVVPAETPQAPIAAPIVAPEAQMPEAAPIVAPEAPPVVEQKRDDTFEAVRKLQMDKDKEAVSLMLNREVELGNILRCNVLVGSQFPGAKNHYLHSMSAVQQREFIRLLGADLKTALQRAAGEPSNMRSGQPDIQGTMLSHLLASDVSDCNSYNAESNKATPGLVFAWVLTYSSPLGAQECLNKFQSIAVTPEGQDGLNYDTMSPSRGSGFRLSSPTRDHSQGGNSAVIQIPQARQFYKETGGRPAEVPFAILSDFIRSVSDNNTKGSQGRSYPSPFNANRQILVEKGKELSRINIQIQKRAQSMEYHTSPRSTYSKSVSPINYTNMSNDFSSSQLKVKKAGGGLPPSALLESVLDDRAYRQPHHQHSQGRSGSYRCPTGAYHTSMIQALSSRGPVMQSGVYPYLNTVTDNCNYSTISPVAHTVYGPESHHRSYYIDQQNAIGPNRGMLVPHTADAPVIALLDLQEREMDLQAKELMTEEAQDVLLQQTAELQVLMEEQIRRMDELDKREQMLIAKEEHNQTETPQDMAVVEKLQSLEKDLTAVETENELLKCRLNNVSLFNTHSASYAKIPGAVDKATEDYKAKLYAERERALQKRTQELLDREAALSLTEARLGRQGPSFQERDRLKSFSSASSRSPVHGALSFITEASRPVGHRTSEDRWDTQSFASPVGMRTSFGCPGSAIEAIRNKNLRCSSTTSYRSPQGNALLNKLSSLNPPGGSGHGMGQKRSLGGSYM